MTLDQHCRDYETRFHEYWPRLIADLNAKGPDAFWLIRHASYLFRTGAVRWGIDLSLRTNELKAFTTSRAAQDLSTLDFVLVTHFHSDHYDSTFCAQLGGLDTLWIIPDFADGFVRETILAIHKNVRFVTAGEEIDVKDHHITVLPGHHYDDGGTTGIAAYSYAIKTPEQTLFFPGDVRDFRTCTTVDCPNADVLFAHVWLGRSCALLPIEETFIEPYCDYLARSGAKCVSLAHLNDYCRSETERWTESHALEVMNGFIKRCPETPIYIPHIGMMQLL